MVDLEAVRRWRGEAIAAMGEPKPTNTEGWPAHVREITDERNGQIVALANWLLDDWEAHVASANTGSSEDYSYLDDLDDSE